MVNRPPKEAATMATLGIICDTGPRPDIHESMFCDFHDVRCQITPNPSRMFDRFVFVV